MYAKNTKVSVEKSIGEIQKLVSKYKASGFMFATMEDQTVIGFVMSGRSIRMRIRTMKIESSMKEKRVKEVEQVNRSLLRSLVLCIKAKLEAVSSGIETFEQAFMPYILINKDQTIGDKVLPYIDSSTIDEPAKLLGMPQ